MILFSHSVSSASIRSDKALVRLRLRHCGPISRVSGSRNHGLSTIVPIPRRDPSNAGFAGGGPDRPERIRPAFAAVRIHCGATEIVWPEDQIRNRLGELQASIEDSPPRRRSVVHPTPSPRNWLYPSDRAFLKFGGRGRGFIVIEKLHRAAKKSAFLIVVTRMISNRRRPSVKDVHSAVVVLLRKTRSIVAVQPSFAIPDSPREHDAELQTIQRNTS